MLRITDNNLDTEIAARLKARDEYGHKGNFGTLTVVAGSARYRGCAWFNCSGALRAGCGIVRLAATERVISHITLPEVTFCPLSEDADGCAEDIPDAAFRSADAVLFGSGLGTSPSTLSMMMKIPRSIPAVIDADGLNSTAVYGNPDLLSGRIITPHIGEFARLANMDADTVAFNRDGCAKNFADRYGITVVLKDSVTVIASPNRQTARVEIPNSGMAKGGSGDLLAGIIGSLLAQGYESHNAALLGVLLHCRAGLDARGKFGATSMLPSDTAQYICRNISDQI